MADVNLELDPSGCTRAYRGWRTVCAVPVAPLAPSVLSAPRRLPKPEARKPVAFGLVIYIVLGLLAFCAPYVPAAEIAVCFTPEYGMTPSCTQEVVDALTGARKSVLVQAYSFTSAPIAKALVDAHRRGVEVKVILDHSNRTAHYSAATFLAHAGIPVWIDAQHAIAHNPGFPLFQCTTNLLKDWESA